MGNTVLDRPVGIASPFTTRGLLPSTGPVRTAPADTVALRGGVSTDVFSPTARIDRDTPTAIAPNGDVDYYRQRHDDFVRRNPGVEPPDYYLNYGDKYANRFTNELRPNLSPRGQEWLDEARRNLQEAIENRRAEDPAAFAELERDPEAFRRFAYDTHPGAYRDAGLASLPPRDLAQIPVTPDRRDLLSADGIRQVIQTGVGVAGDWARMGAERVADTRVGRAVTDGVRAAADTRVGRAVVDTASAGLGHIRDGAEWVADSRVGRAVGTAAGHVGEAALNVTSRVANGVADGVEYVADTRVGRAVGDGARWVADTRVGRAVGDGLGTAWNAFNSLWD